MTYAVVPGRKVTVSERGWFAPPYTACRFAGETQIAIRTGYDMPLDRHPDGAENAVRDMQMAGDPTPKDGSTLRQGQRAVAKLLPNAPIKWGRMSEAEVLDAVGRGASVGFSVHMDAMPRHLRRFCGYGYTGDHYMVIDGADGGTVDLSDPMYRPAVEARPQVVLLSEIRRAVIKDDADNWIVCVGFESAAYYDEQLADVNAKIAASEAELAELEVQQADLEAKIADQVI